jgi:hypothetical protein
MNTTVAVTANANHQSFFVAGPAPAPYPYPYPYAHVNTAGMRANSSYGSRTQPSSIDGSTPLTSLDSNNTSTSGYGSANFAAAPRQQHDGFLPAATPSAVHAAAANLPGYAPTTAPGPFHAPLMMVAPQATLLMAPTGVPATAPAPAVLPSASIAPLYIDLTTAGNDDGEDGDQAAGLDNLDHAWAPVHTATAAIMTGAAVQTQAELQGPTAVAAAAIATVVVPATGPRGQQKRPADAQETANILEWDVNHQRGPSRLREAF